MEDTQAWEVGLGTHATGSWDLGQITSRLLALIRGLDKDILLHTTLAHFPTWTHTYILALIFNVCVNVGMVPRASDMPGNVPLHSPCSYYYPSRHLRDRLN